MSMIDQCPSTKGKKSIPEAAPELGRMSGRPYWRSVEEFAASPSFDEFVQREFPVGASELAASAGGSADSRREFLKLMAASLALAGAATIPGCRRPDHKILPYSQTDPEHIIPGRPLFYATSLAVPGGGAEGLVVETHTGRPTKVEGNPLHPVNRGKSSIAAQAAVLTLYDPDRLKYPRFNNPARGRLDATWDDFKAWQGEHFAGHEADGGTRLAFVLDKKTSPTYEAMRSRLARRFPNATFVWWDSVDARRGELDGTAAAFGSAMRVHRDFSGAACVLSLDSDFMDEGPGALLAAREFAATRSPMHSGDAMSRLYVAESRPTGTGAMADHRFALSPSGISAFGIAVARAVFQQTGMSVDLPSAGSLDAEMMQVALHVAEDLVEASNAKPGSAMVVAGSSQAAGVHALVAALNEALGAGGRSVTYTPASDAEAADPMAGLASLTGLMTGGRIETLVCVGANPVHTAPVDLGFAEAFAAVPTTIALSVEKSETAIAATWELNGAHPLESWGDSEALDGTIAPQQPMIAPLYAPAMSDIEFMALLAGTENPDGHEIVRRVWSRRLGVATDSDRFGRVYRRALHDGVLAGTAATPSGDSRVRAAGVASAIAAVELGSGEGLEVVFTAGRVGDGRLANCGWLQELPQMGSMVCWDNPAYVSPRTAEELGLLPLGTGDADGDLAGAYTSRQIPKARVGTLTVGDRSMDIAVWILPGMPDNVVHLQVGYGRTDVGSVGQDVGFDVSMVRSSASPRVVRGARLERTSGTFAIASTQNHWSMESRTSIVRAMDKKWFDKHEDGKPTKVKDKIYGKPYAELPLAEKLGELAHTPANVSIYDNPMNESPQEPVPGSAYATGPQWGMSIDLGKCTGCGVCTVACQSENNIPIVGKAEVAKGREMTWIRVDRYFTGDDLNSPDEMVHQPVACVHCENAPCETVCPVTATVHGPEGTNNMAYNRCIGTRYCANNCPYKVRRFNFFDYSQVKYNGGLAMDVLDENIDLPDQRKVNKNFIPPRLREKLDEITHMQMNPDVTVRGRGVMEKCSYCIQRVNEARQQVKVRDIWKNGQNVAMGEGYEAPIPDGFFESACQQACPTDAIVFGDILDPGSRVSTMRENERSYLLLGYLDTRPRTTYMMRVRNPNPLIRVYDEHDPLDHGGGHGGVHENDRQKDGHGEGHGDGHGHEQGETAFIDPRKRSSERGYLASLRVMG